MTCLVCLQDAGAEAYHPSCARRVFGHVAAPTIDLDMAKLQNLALAMAGRTSVTGIQRKISLGVSVGRGASLHVVSEGGSFILKPQAVSFPNVPENEHLTMSLAAIFGIEVPAFALVRMQDRALAYIVRRFDRLPDGTKLRQEDFCQLAGFPARSKYRGSAELCVRLVRRFAGEPLVQLLELYRRQVFTWWTGNGDMHLKNFSLLVGTDGIPRLSPAYDLLNTRLLVPGDTLAMPIGGKKDRLTTRRWRELAGYMELPERAVRRVHAAVSETLDRMLALVAASPLPEKSREEYAKLLRTRAKDLSWKE